MWRFLARRLTFFLFTLIFTSLLIFGLTRVLPGDVARVIGGREASDGKIAEIRTELGLNQPLRAQYLEWTTGFVTGNWGQTYTRPRQDIREVVVNRLVNSARLALITLLIAVPLAILLGVVAGLTENRLPDNIISILTLSVASLPEFVTGIFLIEVLAYWFRDALGITWFSASSSIPTISTFAEALPVLWLPAITASLVLIGYIARLTRAGVIEELKRDYVRTAALKGMPYRQVMFKHVLRNALIPTITVIATSTGWLVSGLVIIESVFSYPGIGRLLIFAINNRDLPTIQAIVMVTVAVILVANFTADLLYAVLNPRIQLE